MAARGGRTGGGPCSSCPRPGCRTGAPALRLLDQLDPVAVRIAHEAEQGTPLADAVRRLLRLDPVLPELGQRRVHVVDRDRDVAVAATEVVRAPGAVEGQLELFLLAGHREEVVRRLLLPVADDVHVTAELEDERLVEGAASFRVGDAVHGVEIARHGEIVRQAGTRRAGMEKLSAGGGGEGRRSRCLVLAHVVECRPRLGRLLVVLWAADVEPKAAEVVNPDRLARASSSALIRSGKSKAPSPGSRSTRHRSRASVRGIADVSSMSRRRAVPRSTEAIADGAQSIEHSHVTVLLTRARRRGRTGHSGRRLY